MPHTILAIDTSTQTASLCLQHNGQRHTQDIAASNTQAAELLPAIEQLLNGSSIWYDDLDELTITVGPGRFTGLRIGLAVARTIAFAHPNLALHPFTTMECLAIATHQTTPTDHIHTTLNAGKGELYYQSFTLQGDQLAASSAPQLLKPEDLPEGATANSPIAPHASLLLDALTLIAPRDEPLPLKPLYIRPPDAKLPQKKAL